MEQRIVRLENHEETIRGLNRRLAIDPRRTAVVTVDMHRGHLDPVHATMPVLAEDRAPVIEATRRLLGTARSLGMPVIHVLLTLRPIESERIRARFVPERMILSSDTPMTEARSMGLRHNLTGTVQTQLMPELGPEPTDHVIDNKKTASAFVGTDLDNLLTTLDVGAVVIVGINTNTCVQCSAFDAVNLGYDVVVVSDCVASMYGRDLHEMGLENIRRCIGWVLTLEELTAKLADGAPFEPGRPTVHSGTEV